MGLIELFGSTIHFGEPLIAFKYLQKGKVKSQNKQWRSGHRLQGERINANSDQASRERNIKRIRECRGNILIIE